MAGHIGTRGVIAALLLLSGTGRAEAAEECKNLTRQQIGSIIDQELVRRFGDEDRPQTVKIDVWRKGCDYYYHEQVFPWSPGSGFGFKFDDEGKVLEFIPDL